MLGDLIVKLRDKLVRLGILRPFDPYKGLKVSSEALGLHWAEASKRNTVV